MKGTNKMKSRLANFLKLNKEAYTRQVKLKGKKAMLLGTLTIPIWLPIFLIKPRIAKLICRLKGHDFEYNLQVHRFVRKCKRCKVSQVKLPSSSPREEWVSIHLGNGEEIKGKP